MGTNRNHNCSNGSNYCFDQGRYCNYCSICHSDSSKRCKGDSEKRKKDNNSKLTAREDSVQYHLYEADDRYEDDRSEKDDRYEKDNRPQKSGQHVLAHRNTGADQNQEEYLHKDHPEQKLAPYKQTHVHEYQGSTKLAKFSEDAHIHRFAGITGEAILSAGSHIHKVWTRTDFFDHFHFIEYNSGPAIYMDKDKCVQGDGSVICEEPHIHYVTGLTSTNDQHNHEFQFATLIDSPLLPET